MGTAGGMYMKRDNKGQFFIASMIMFFLVIVFLYSLETENTYKSYSGKNDILNNLRYETCQVAQKSNGTYLDSRFNNLTAEIQAYCSGYQMMHCNLTITKSSGAPSNLSLLNYTHYNYSLDYRYQTYQAGGSFNCSND